MKRRTYSDNRKPRSDAGRHFVNIPRELLKRLRHAAENAIDRCTKPSHVRYSGQIANLYCISQGTVNNCLKEVRH